MASPRGVNLASRPRGTSSSGGPLASHGCHQIPSLPRLTDVHAIRRPSGVYTGPSFVPSVVRRAKVPELNSYTQMSLRYGGRPMLTATRRPSGDTRGLE